MAPVFAYLHQSVNHTSSGTVDELSVTGFAGTAGSLIGTEKKVTPRFVLIGSPYHIDMDSAASFGPDEYPSLDHILADPTASPYGTRGLDQLFQGIAVAWITIDDSNSSSRARFAVTSFWSAYFAHLGAVLTTDLDSASDVTRRAVSGAMEPVPAELLQPTGKLQIMKLLPIAPQPHSAPSTSQPSASTVVNAGSSDGHSLFEIPVVPNQAIEPTVAMGLLCDGSCSMDKPLREVPRVSSDIATVVSQLSRRFQMALLIHRGTDRISEWKGVIDRSNADGYSAGLASFQHWSTDPSLKVRIVDGQMGEHAGKETGQTKNVTPFEPVITFVNIENAIKHALGTLEGFQAERHVLIVIGDAGPCEFDGEEGVSDADRASGARALDMVRQFCQSYPEARILTVYTGPHEGEAGFTSDNADTIQFFKDVAAIAKGHGKYSENLNDLPDLIKRAILNP
jgi:hypothetical protein